MITIVFNLRNLLLPTWNIEKPFMKTDDHQPDNCHVIQCVYRYGTRRKHQDFHEEKTNAKSNPTTPYFHENSSRCLPCSSHHLYHQKIFWNQLLKNASTTRRSHVKTSTNLSLFTIVCLIIDSSGSLLDPCHCRAHYL